MSVISVLDIKICTVFCQQDHDLVIKNLIVDRCDENALERRL